MVFVLLFVAPLAIFIAIGLGFAYVVDLRNRAIVSDLSLLAALDVEDDLPVAA